MKTEKIEAIPFSRCSTVRQKKGDTFDRQEVGCRNVVARYAESKGVFLSTRFTYGKFRQAGSAYKGKLLAKGGALCLFLELVRNGEIGRDVPAVLVIAEWSRFSRIAPIDALDVLKEIVRAGVSIAVYSPDMWVDNESVNGQPFIILAICL